MILWGRLPHLRVSNGAYLVQKSASPEAGATLFLGGVCQPLWGPPRSREGAWHGSVACFCAARGPQTP